MRILVACEESQAVTIVASTKEETEQFNSSKRFCCASRPVSSHGENPFKQRYCKQFEEPYRGGARKGGFISKEEAKRLMKMTASELVEYWNTRAQLSRQKGE